MSAKTRCTFKVRMPILIGVVLYSGASVATNDRNGSASATKYLNESQVALRNKATVPEASQVTIEPEDKTSGLNVTQDTQAAQFAEPRSSTPGDFNGPISRASTLEVVGEPPLMRVKASPPDAARSMAPDRDMPAPIGNDFQPDPWIIGLALLGFVMYSRRGVAG